MPPFFFFPYPISGGTIMVLSPPALMSASPISSPLMTCNENATTTATSKVRKIEGLVQLRTILAYTPSFAPCKLLPRSGPS